MINVKNAGKSHIQLLLPKSVRAPFETPQCPSESIWTCEYVRVGLSCSSLSSLSLPFPITAIMTSAKPLPSRLGDVKSPGFVPASIPIFALVSHSEGHKRCKEYALRQVLGAIQEFL